MKKILFAALLLLGSMRVFAQQILIEDHTLNAGDIYLGPAHNLKVAPPVSTPPATSFAGVQYLYLTFTPIGGSSFTSCGVSVDSDVPSAWNIGGAVVSQNCASAGTYSSPSAITANNVRLNAGAVGNGTVRIQLWGCFSSCSANITGAVSSVANGDSTLSFSPTTGAVVGSLNLAHANTWSTTQTFGNVTATGVVDFSASSISKFRVGAGLTSSANGDFGFDSTSNNWHGWNGADSIFAPLATGFVSGDCGQPTSSGGKWTTVDAGAPCGTGSGANSALSNLASVNINSSLLSQTGVDLGGTTKPFRNLYLFGAGTYGTTYFLLGGTPTSTRTVTFPDNTGTVGELNFAQTWSALQTFGTNISIGGVTATGATGTGNNVFATSPTVTGLSTNSLACGVLNTTACVLTGYGSTSGTATLTWPAVASTITNPIVSSNNLSAPALISTVAIGTAPLQVTSNTNVPNLNASSLSGATFAAPGAIGSGTASTGAFTTLSASSTVSGSGFSTYLASPPAIGGSAAAAGTFAGLTGTGTVDFSGSTIAKLRVGAGLTTSANGDFGYDSTNANWHGWDGADLIFAPLASGFVSGDCGQPTKTGNKWTIVDAGAACGTGGGGANTALSNLAAVAVSAALSPGTDNSISLDGLSNRYINFWSSGVFGWTNGSGTADTGLSRDAAGVVDVGNGTAGNASASLKAANLTDSALSQYSIPYGGVGGILTPLTGSTQAVGVPSFLESTPTSGPTAAAPVWGLAGVPVDNNSETTCAAGTLNILDRATAIFCSGGTTATFTLPVHTTSGFGSNFPFVIPNNNSGSLTLTPTTDTIDNGTVLSKWASFVYNNSSGNWQTINVPQFAAFGSNCTNGLTWSTTTGIGCAASAPGTATSVGLSVQSGSSSGIFAVTGSPVTTSGTLNFNLAGTSGGHPYFSSSTVLSSTTAQTTHGVWLAEGAGNADVTTGAGTTNMLLASGGGSADPAYKSWADLDSTQYIAATGTAQAQVATLAPPVTSLANGLEINFLPVAANTAAAPTLAVNGLTAKPITKLGTAALVANDLTTTAIASVIYDGTEFQLQNPQTSTGGGVTSVAETVPSWLTVTGSPITTSGTLAVTATTGQTSHQVIGTCGSGTSFAPCPLVAGDLPAVPLSGLATQSANTVVANVTGSTAVPTATSIPAGIQNFVAGTGYNQATGHQLQVPLACADSSGSGTAQSCSTGGTTYTPAAYDCVLYSTTTTNSGTGLTINVDSLGAKSVAIPGSAGWTTTLTVAIIPANKPQLLCYDGTNWDDMQTGASGNVAGTSLTGNVLTKANSANSIGNSSVTDNGTTVSTTEPIVSPSYNLCPDSSGSGTAQVCNTTPTFTVVTGSCITYTTTTANTGTGLTWNVNSLGAKSVAKWQGSTTLAANDVLANKQVNACYDGTNWELSTIGNAPGGTGTDTSVGLSVQGGSSSGIFAITGSPVTTSGTLNFNLLGTSGGIPYFSSTTVLTSSTALAANQAVNGGGAGAAPVTGFTDTAGTITSGHLACYTASNTIGNCTGTPSNNIIGVFNSSTTWIASGETSVTLDATVNVTFGDILCASSTAGDAHDNGTSSCASGEWIGIVKTTASSVSSATAFVTLR